MTAARAATEWSRIIISVRCDEGGASFWLPLLLDHHMIEGSSLIERLVGEHIHLKRDAFTN